MPPATPYLLVNHERLMANIARTAARTSAADVALRPHVKTHKSPDIARLQLAAGAVGISVATVGEAQVFADAGVNDIFIAYPLWIDQERATRMREVMTRAVLAFGLDSPTAAWQAARFLAGTGARALIEVDSGHHRSGVRPEEAAVVARAALDAGLDVGGVFTFPGHGYAPGLGAAAAHDEAAALSAAAEALSRVGIAAPVLSGGSTPTLVSGELAVLTELRPGVYVFGDAQQWELGSMRADDIALTCRATVISHAGGRAVLDCGSKILGADRAPYATGFGRLLHHPESRIVLLSEHHAVVDMMGAVLPSLGQVVDVVPNHVCNAVNLVDVLYVEQDGQTSSWPVAARGRNS